MKKNPYLENQEDVDQEKVVTIKKQEIIFNKVSCVLILISDQTALYKIDQEKKEKIGMTRANACISNQFHTPLKTINMYTEILTSELAD